MIVPRPVVHPCARKLRVLVADDDCDCTDSLVELLNLLGCNASGCYDSGAVLPLAELFRPDVCVLDVRMPGLDGWTLAPLLRRWAGERPLLLIAHTGLASEYQKQRSLDVGFDHHLSKPASLQELSGCIGKFIDQDRCSFPRSANERSLPERRVLPECTAVP